MKVWNLRDPNCPKDAVYCGRGSPYGNPFRIGDVWDTERMDRDDVCNRFECEVLPTLDVSALKGRNLKCYCKPARCHCDSILRKANSALELC